MDRKATVRIFPDFETMSKEAALLFLRVSSECIALKKSFIVALSGGLTPGKLYFLLGSDFDCNGINWKYVHLFWTDERCVVRDHEDSNYRAAYKALISKVPLPYRNIHRIKGETGPEEGSRIYEKELRDFFNTENIPVFDLIILGVGKDGHTASLFPDSDFRKEKKRLVMPVYMEKPGKNRITLTLPVLNNSKNILFLAAGIEKAEIISAILDNEKKGKYPAGLVNPARGNLLIFTDASAGSKLIKH